MHSPTSSSVSEGGARFPPTLVCDSLQEGEQQQKPGQREEDLVTTTSIEKQLLTAGTLSSALRSYQYVTSGFYKFLARFSGESSFLH